MNTTITARETIIGDKIFYAGSWCIVTMKSEGRNFTTLALTWVDGFQHTVRLRSVKWVHIIRE